MDKREDFDGEEHLCLLFFVLFFCFTWFEFYFQIITDVILVHIWILEYIFVIGVYSLIFLICYDYKL